MIILRKSLIKQFPYTIKIKSYSDNRAFNWCINVLEIEFKEDFDVRAANFDIGSDFYFKDLENFIAFKLRWQ